MRVFRRLLAAQASLALYALVALALKAKSTTSTGGKATTNGSWADALKPKTAEENDCTVISPASLEWNSGETIESMVVASGGSFTGASNNLNIGTAKEPPSAIFLAFAEGATVPFSMGANFSSTWTGVGTISLGGHPLQGTVNFLTVAGVGGKYKLLGPAKLSTGSEKLCTVEEKVQLDLNGQNVESWWFHGSAGSTLKGLTGTTFTILASTALQGFDVAATATLEGEPSVVFTATANPSAERQCNLGGHAFVAVTWVAYTLVEGSSTTGTFNLNNKAVPGECKATMTALSNHLVVTSGEAALFPRAEVAVAGIPLGTTIIKKIEAGVWEMSANATETVVVAQTVTVYNPGIRFPEGTTQTVTTLTCNGTEAEPVRVASTVAGKPWTLKLPAGNTQLTAVMRVKDLTVPEGSKLYLPNSVNLGGNNANVKFEAAPTEKVQKLEAGLSFAGRVERATSHSLTAGLTLAGANPRSTLHQLPAALTFQGALSRRTLRSLAASLGFVGALPRNTTHQATASLTPTGVLRRNIAHGLTGALSFLGKLTPAKTGELVQRLEASLSFKGSLPRNTSRALPATVSFQGALPKTVTHTLRGSLTPVGALPRTVGKAFSASITPQGVLGRTISKQLRAALSFTGRLHRAGAKALGLAGRVNPRALLGRSSPAGKAGRSNPRPARIEELWPEDDLFPDTTLYPGEQLVPY